MYIWLSEGAEGVPEQDNEIACQVIWFENSSHLWTGVWANKPRVCQDSLFFKLLYTVRLSLQDMSKCPAQSKRWVGDTELVPDDREWLRPSSRLSWMFVSCWELSQRNAQVLGRQCDDPSTSRLTQVALAELNSKCPFRGARSVGLWILALVNNSICIFAKLIFLKLSFRTCNM